MINYVGYYYNSKNYSKAQDISINGKYECMVTDIRKSPNMAALIPSNGEELILLVREDTKIDVSITPSTM